MLHLILKDFKSYWRYQLILAGFVFTFNMMLNAVMLIDDGGGILSVSIGGAVLFCSLSAFQFLLLDDKLEADMAFASLPVSRATIVRSRYVTSFTQALCALLLVLLSLFPARALQQSDPVFDTILSPPGTIMIAIIVVVVLSISLPFYFKFGFDKGVWAAVTMQLSLMLLAALVDFVFNALKGRFHFDPAVAVELIRELVLWFRRSSGHQAYWILTAVVVGIVQASLRLSIRFYERRNL